MVGIEGFTARRSRSAISSQAKPIDILPLEVVVSGGSQLQPSQRAQGVQYVVHLGGLDTQNYLTYACTKEEVDGLSPTQLYQRLLSKAPSVDNPILRATLANNLPKNHSYTQTTSLGGDLQTNTVESAKGIVWEVTGNVAQIKLNLIPDAGVGYR